VAVSTDPEPTTTTETTDTTVDPTTDTTDPEPYCGDGNVDPDEECDDGEANADDAACTTACVTGICGDGLVIDGVEACDDGNDDNEDGCLDTCVEASCGDSFVGPGESCDDGNDVNDDDCTNNCALASCGDAIIQGEEDCDDGNLNDTDACLNTCVTASCGDGAVWADNEACDDGNLDDTDDCTTFCAAPACDDGLVSGDESDLDCGGSCEGCELAFSCTNSGDCLSQFCTNDVCALPTSCAALNDATPNLPSGIYLIDVDGDENEQPFEVHCDMETDGGGWTLAMQNNGMVTPGPNPLFAAAINEITTTGMFGDDLALFDLFIGLKFWAPIGSELRIEVGSAPGVLTKQAIYPYSLDANNNYALAMDPGMVTIGMGEPGIKLYHANTNIGLTTEDADNDSYVINCASLYNYAWWYRSCWSGSLWGSQQNNYQDLPYWNGSGGDFHQYGAIWLR